MSIHSALPLYESPGRDWEEKAYKLMKDEYVKNKCNRERRLEEKDRYFRTYCQELFNTSVHNSVLDLGPGPGEFLEICRLWNCFILGIDSSLDSSYIGMGRNYLEYSKLMTERQKIPVNYEGLDNLLEQGKLKFPDSFFTLVNSQGSITYIFSKYLVKEKEKFNSNLKLNEQSKGVLKWERTPELENIADKFLSEMSRILRKHGVLLIYVNEPKTKEELEYYQSLMFGNLKNYGLRMKKEYEPCIHKVEKV